MVLVNSIYGTASWWRSIKGAEMRDLVLLPMVYRMVTPLAVSTPVSFAVMRLMSSKEFSHAVSEHTKSSTTDIK